MRVSASIPKVNTSKEKSIPLKTVISPWCAECTISHLSMTPVTSPIDHSPVKPSPGVHSTEKEDNSKSDIGEIQFYDCDQLEGCSEENSYNPERMEMDDTYHH